MKEERYEMIDILKGIGMVSMMIGHSVWVLPVTHFRIGEFIYLYHIIISDWGTQKSTIRCDRAIFVCAWQRYLR